MLICTVGKESVWPGLLQYCSLTPSTSKGIFFCHPIALALQFSMLLAGHNITWLLVFIIMLILQAALRHVAIPVGVAGHPPAWLHRALRAWQIISGMAWLQRHAKFKGGSSGATPSVLDGPPCLPCCVRQVAVRGKQAYSAGSKLNQIRDQPSALAPRNSDPMLTLQLGHQLGPDQLIVSTSASGLHCQNMGIACNS